jgi:hypothetical protein
MTITVLLDPTQMPDQSQDQLDFDNKMAGFMRDLPTLATQINETTAGLNAVATGGAYALPYIFDTATADADPGAGKLRLSSATQSAATVMRLDLTAGGQDYTTLIDTMDGSTSVIKGSIRLVKQGDLSKWLTFDVTARAAPSGYRNLTVVCTDSSSASPFAAGDALMLFFQRNGDRGQPGANGVLALATATVTTPVLNIDFLNIFTSEYDKYTIEIQGISFNAYAQLAIGLAYGGVVSNTGDCYYAVIGSEVSASNLNFGIAIMSANGKANVTIEIKNVNGSGVKGISSKGMFFNSPNYLASAGEGVQARTASATGFRIYSPQSASIASATVRVFGHRNS